MPTSHFRQVALALDTGRAPPCEQLHIDFRDGSLADIFMLNSFQHLNI